MLILLDADRVICVTTKYKLSKKTNQIDIFK